MIMTISMNKMYRTIRYLRKNILLFAFVLLISDTERVLLLDGDLDCMSRSLVELAERLDDVGGDESTTLDDINIIRIRQYPN